MEGSSSHDMNEIIALRRNLEKGNTKSFADFNNFSQSSCIDSTKQSQVSRFKKIKNFLIGAHTELTPSINDQNDNEFGCDKGLARKGVQSTITEVNYVSLQYQMEINRLDAEVKYHQLKLDNLIRNEHKAMQASIDSLKAKIKQQQKDNDAIRKQNSSITQANNELKNQIQLLKATNLNQTTVKATANSLTKSNSLFD